MTISEQDDEDAETIDGTIAHHRRRETIVFSGFDDNISSLTTKLTKLLLEKEEQSTTYDGDELSLERHLSLEFQALSWDEELQSRVSQLLAKRQFHSVEIIQGGGDHLPSDWTSVREELLFQQIRLPQNLDVSSTLTVLSFRSVSFSRFQVQNLARIIVTNQRLKKLDLSDSRFVDDGVDILASGLEENRTLGTLILSDCQLMDEQVAAVINALSHNPSLQEIDICFNKCRSQGVQALTELVQSTSSLQILKMGFQAFGQGRSIDLSPLLAALQTNQHLQELEVSGNSLRDHVMPNIVDLLRLNKTITALDLSENRFTNAGMITFGRNLPNYLALRRLVMEDNRFDCGVVEHLLRGMERNYTLGDFESSIDTKQAGDSWGKLLYNLDLNWGGRKLILQNDDGEHLNTALLPLLLARANQTRRKLVDTLSRTPNCYDIIFYFLRNGYAVG